MTIMSGQDLNQANGSLNIKFILFILALNENFFFFSLYLVQSKNVSGIFLFFQACRSYYGDSATSFMYGIYSNNVYIYDIYVYMYTVQYYILVKVYTLDNYSGLL